MIEHGILRKLVSGERKKQPDLINVIHLGGPDVFSPLLEPLGLKVNLVMGGSTLDKLAQMSEAQATVTMCFVLSYLATGLEQGYGVPEVKAPLPYGLDDTRPWRRRAAAHRPWPPTEKTRRREGHPAIRVQRQDEGSARRLA